ncbi:MAG TPA: hypothetical protein VMU50_16535 [Polyangia bacterium]|nr:hypothetical protein [Polyangia bacterium]
MQIAPLGVLRAEAAEVEAALPVDRRLDRVREALEVTMADAARAGLPVAPLVDKVREGLAKGVPPEAIRQAAAHMVDKQIEARAFVAAHRREEPAFELVRAVAVARESGISDRDLAPLVETLAPVPTGARAVEVVMALARRGYDPVTASAAVQTVALREPAAVERVPAGIEAIRAAAGGGAGGQAAAVEALRRGLAAADGGSFETVVARAVDEARKAPGGVEKRRRRRTRGHPLPAPAAPASPVPGEAGR